MNIGIDISQIAYKGTGVARFTHGLVNEILKNDSKHTWFFFFSSFRNNLDNEIIHNIKKGPHHLYSFPFPPTILSLAANNFRGISKSLISTFGICKNLDWFITSDWIEFPTPIKKATIIHDLVFKKYPETVHPKIISAQEKRLEQVSKESHIIFVDSKATSHDLQDAYNISPSRIIENYPGVEVTKAPDKTQQTSILTKLNISSPYILSVGKHEPRKNLQRLIDAFDNLKETNSSLQLIIVGPGGWGDAMHSAHNKNIRFLGYVEDDVLATLYVNAICFIYPSLYEGFGYPIIEAMKYGCPVATSDVSSMPEVSGNAAFLFDPKSIPSIQSTLDQMLNSEKLREAFIKKGFLQSKKFTWKKYYNTLIEALEENHS